MRLWCILALCASAWLSTSADKKQVVTSLNSKWKHTSFLAETSEFIAKESNTLFWQFVDQVTENVNQSSWQTRTHETEFDFSLKQAVHLLSEARSDLLKFALALRLHSPKVQLFQHTAEEYAVRRPAFVDLNGKVITTAEELTKALDNAGPGSPAILYSVDHVYPGAAEEPTTTAILYAELGSEAFEDFHRVLKTSAKNGKVRYVFRHFAQKKDDATVGLCGYGVELAIKNTEYKAVDDSNIKKTEQADDEENEEDNDVHGFNFNILKKNNVHLREQLKQFKNQLSDLEELTPLKQWEVTDISYQAAQKIVDAPKEEAIPLLIDIAQNFPLRARSLVQTKIKPEFRSEVASNQENFATDFQMTEGENALFINGINIDVDSLDVFQLFDIINQEERLSSAFYEMGFRREYLSLLFNLDLSEDKTSFAVDFREAYPEYINNLDKDKQYRDWGNSVRLLLQPYFPGMIRPIARNLFTLIVVVDPADPEAASLIKIAHSLFIHQVPLRIGFIFVVNDDKAVSGKTDVGVALLNLYNFAKIDKTPAKAIHLLTKLYDSAKGEQLTVEDVHKFFRKTFPDQEVDDVFSVDSDYDTGRTSGKAFLERSALGRPPKVLLNGVILDDAGLKADKIEETILMQVMRLTVPLQRAVMGGKLNDKENIQNWILSQPDVLPRLNNRLLSPPSDYLTLHSVNPCKATAYKNFVAASSAERAQCILERTKTLSRTEDDTTRWLTVWLVGDLDTSEGRKLLSNGLKAIKKSHNVRLGVIHNGAVSAEKPLRASWLIHSIIRLTPSNLAKQMLHKLLQKDGVALETLLKSEKVLEEISVHGMNLDAFKKEWKGLSTEQMKSESFFAINDLGLKQGQRAVVVNGMLFGPFADDEAFEQEDFALLEKLAERKGAKAIAEQVDRWEVPKEGGKSSDVVMRSIAVIGKHAAKKTRTWVTFQSDTESVVNLMAEDQRRPVIDVIAVVDPLSKGAQKLAPILEIITKVVNADLKIAMNPKGKLSELPLRRFYRYAVEEQPSFDANGQIVTPKVAFGGLPSKQLLTLNVIAPDSWMVQPVYAEYDLDNIKMNNVKSDVVAKYELAHILLEGHCFDEVTGNPPRGLQFVLGTASDPVKYDTIVMANLGYFQLKASPGAWTLQLREGKSKELYEVKNHTYTEGTSLDKINVLIDDFLGKTIRVRVAKLPGMEEKNLLSNDGAAETATGGDEEEGGSLWPSISRWFSDRVATITGGEKYEKINIFSLASGHLYERFMRIMMLSVMKHTKHPVKFWVLNNYLSPQFRESLPVLAEKYGFEYELVEYKWPRWLHQQTEKQRIMWGYKILFLDVLFPLDVKKIIFVDADQVVRTDMMELMNFDLGGAPYGYTPFCESRKEMDGFRFWKSGYWANHLAGRKYHISALYVVDLVKFRQIAAGDRLRGQYQGLSSDPNSLANLDQDLPNNMIHQVRIKSLPQEWLWCETWCDDNSLNTAKTIDLCNNPLTKEPKLDSALRLLPEWRDYDDEIKQALQTASTGKQAGKKAQKEESAKHGGEL